MDPDPPLVNKVTMRQVGGRPLGSSKTVWNQMLKSSEAIIDSRVRVDAGGKYLVSSRMNAGKELVVVAFDTLEESRSRLSLLYDSLFTKG
jgi:hypothetical protein